MQGNTLRSKLPGKLADILIILFCLTLNLACVYPFY